MSKKETIIVQGTQIVLYQDVKGDYISLTDIAKYRDSERTDYLIQNWMRNHSTIEFMGLWEQFHNPNFNPIEFDGIKNMAGSNSFSFNRKTMDRKYQCDWNCFKIRAIRRNLRASGYRI